MATQRRIILAAGGTGGHMFPAQALAETLVTRGWDVVLCTDVRGMRYTKSFPKKISITQIGSASPTQGTKWARIGALFLLFTACCKMFLSFLRARPHCVVGFGGYPSFPALVGAWILRVPRVIHEQNACLGRVNRLFVCHVDIFAYSFPIKYFSKCNHALDCGNLVRDQVFLYKNAPYTPFDIKNTENMCDVLIFGGSQGARILTDIVPEAIKILPENLLHRLKIYQQVPASDCKRLVEFYEKIGLNAKIAPFFDDMATHIAQAKLVVSRAGASTLAEISMIGRPAILVPYRGAVNNHQNANARYFSEQNAAILIEEKGFSPQSCADAIMSIIENPVYAAKLADAAFECARPGAAQRLANAIENIVRDKYKIADTD